MNILIFWPIFGLMNLAVAHGTENHEKRHLGRVQHVERHNLLFRESSKEENSTTPKYPQVVNSKSLADYDGFNLIFNSEERLVGFVNVSENVGYAFLQRKGGSIKFLLNSKTGALIRYTTLKQISLIKNDGLKCDVLNSFSTILKKYEYQNETVSGDTSEIEPSSEEGLDLLSDVYLHLGHPKEKGDRRYRSFLFVSKLTKRLKSLYFGSLNGLLEGKGPLPLKQNLNRFLSISLGLHKMFIRANGGLKAILQKVKFDLNAIYNGKNGAEVFVYILRQTGAKFDLGVLWSKLLNDVGELLKIFELLGGGETRNGVDETFGVIGHIWESLNGRESLPSLVKFLLESSSEENWTKGDDGDFTNVVKDIKNVTDEQTKRYDNSGLLTPFEAFFSNLTGNTLIKNGVNVSEIVEKWRKRDVIGGLKFVIDVYFKFSGPQLYSNLIFDSFTSFLNSTSEPKALKNLVPGLSIENITSSGGSLWENICKVYDVDGQLTKNGNSTDVLNRVPVFSEFSKVYKDSYGKSPNFTNILNGSSITQYLTKFVTGPTKWSTDIISHAVLDSGSFAKHIFWDPWKPFVPSALVPPKVIPQVINPISIPPGISTDSKDPQTTKKPCEDECEEKETEPSTKKKDEDSTKKIEEETSTKKEEGETTTQSECDDCDKKKAAKGEATAETEPSTKKTDEPCDDCGTKQTEKTEKVETTTEKECDDCSKKSTTDKEVDAPTPVNLIPIEYKHYGHHNRQNHHGNSNHNDKHHFKGHHQVKHHQHHQDFRGHQMHEKKHHSNSRHNLGHKNEEKKIYRHHQRNLPNQNKKIDSQSLNGY